MNYYIGFTQQLLLSRCSTVGCEARYLRPSADVHVVLSDVRHDNLAIVMSENRLDCKTPPCTT